MNIRDLLNTLAGKVQDETTKLRASREGLESELHRLQSAPLPVEDARARFNTLVADCQARVLKTMAADFTRPEGYERDRGHIMHNEIALLFALVPERVWGLIETQMAAHYAEAPPGPPAAARPQLVEKVSKELKAVNEAERQLLDDLRAQTSRVVESQSNRTVAL